MGGWISGVKSLIWTGLLVPVSYRALLRHGSASEMGVAGRL